jgi:hypothetical protein
MYELTTSEQMLYDAHSERVQVRAVPIDSFLKTFFSAREQLS